MENRIKRVQQRIDANNQPVELSKENEERYFKGPLRQIQHYGFLWDLRV